jgi:hypothetical protein
MTEQEKYYERKNREARELNESLSGLVIGGIVILIIWGAIVAWPVTLGLAIVALVYYVIKKILTTIDDIYTDIANYCKSTFIYKTLTKLFAKINIDLQIVLDVIGILLILGYGFYLFGIILYNRMF